ncbi:MAG: hypothetical protein C1943_01185 [Halochromatium sp.]|nr:hypothetical protein [Halochromatium sp.]
MIGLKRFNCPHCGYRFSWRERSRFSDVLGLKRRAAACPGCGTELTWDKWPWRLLYLGTFGLMLAVILIRFLLPETELSDILLLILELPLITVMLVSAYRLKLIPATLDSHPGSDSTA